MSSNGSAGNHDGQDAGYVLRDWMEATLAEPKSGLSDREWQELARVVRACGTEPAGLAECAQQLVSAFIEIRFPKIRSTEQRERMSQKIAHTLCSDPTARMRLIELQRLLHQSTT